MTTNTEQWNELSAKGDLDGIKAFHEGNFEDRKIFTADQSSKNVYDFDKAFEVKFAFESSDDNE